MKKLFLLFAVAVAAAACNNLVVNEAISEAQERQGWTNFAGVGAMDSGFWGITLPALRGNVESVKIRRSQYSNENDFLLFLFNERGDVAEWGYYSGGYTCEKYVYSYGSNGRLESEYTHGIFEGSTKHTYNELNQRVQTINYNTNYGVASKIRYKYDYAGNMIQEGDVTYVYDNYGRKIVKKSGNEILATWTYDATGKLIESTEVDEYCGNFTKDVYTYDSAGRLDKRDVYYKEDVNEALDYLCTSKYEYDRFGNLVEERMIYANGETGKVSYRYDSHGNVVAKDDITFEITYRK